MVTRIAEPSTHLPLALHRFELAGVVVIAPTVDKQIAAYKALKPDAPDNLREIIEERICEMVPHYCTVTDLPHLKTSYELRDVLAFLEGVRGTIAAGGVVDQAEAERRTNICKLCPYNTNLPGCFACGAIAEATFAVIGPLHTQNMGSLKQCGVCGCSLKAKVWVPQPVLNDLAVIQDNVGKFPSNCWNT